MGEATPPPTETPTHEPLYYPEGEEEELFISEPMQEIQDGTLVTHPINPQSPTHSTLILLESVSCFLFQLLPSFKFPQRACVWSPANQLSSPLSSQEDPPHTYSGTR